MSERKGLRFEVYHDGAVSLYGWRWKLIGAGDVAYAVSPQAFADEKDTRSHIASVRGKFSAARRAKVITVGAGA